MKNGNKAAVDDRLLVELVAVIEGGIARRIDITRKVGVSQATAGRWLKRHARPTGLARLRLEAFLVGISGKKGV